MEHFYNMLFHKSGPANKQQPINQSISYSEVNYKMKYVGKVKSSWPILQPLWNSGQAAVG